MVERLDCRYDDISMTVYPDGQFVSYSDYAALEAQLAEVKAERDVAVAAMVRLSAPKVTEPLRVKLWVTVRVEDTGDGLIINADDAKEYDLKHDVPYEGKVMPDGSYRIALTAAQESGQ